MFGCRIGFPQQYPFSPDVHPCISDEGEFCVCTKHRYGMEEPPLMAVLDTHGRGTIITQQLSNSATQQLSNSATQQLSNSATQQLSNSATQGVRIVHALINGQLFQLDNNIIIFSHQFLQTASVVLGFFILNRKGR